MIHELCFEDQGTGVSTQSKTPDVNQIVQMFGTENFSNNR